jgi:hypothetical protein
MPRHAAQLGSTHTTSMLLSATPERPPAAEPVRASASGGVLCANKPVAMPAEGVPPACTTHHTAGAYNIPCREERGASQPHNTTTHNAKPPRSTQGKLGVQRPQAVCRECPSGARARVPVAGSAAANPPLSCSSGFMRQLAGQQHSPKQVYKRLYSTDARAATLTPKSPKFSDRGLWLPAAARGPAQNSSRHMMTNEPSISNRRDRKACRQQQQQKGAPGQAGMNMVETDTNAHML